jgi:hypothetical protein
MSAFIVGHDHIDALLSFCFQRVGGYQSAVSYYFDGARHDITRETVTETGRILLAENERSVNHRYPGDDGESEAALYTFKAWPFPLTAVSILKGCDCLDYQSCEHDGWEASRAFAILRAIRHRAIHGVPGYDDAGGWEFRRTTEQRQSA